MRPQVALAIAVALGFGCGAKGRKLGEQPSWRRTAVSAPSPSLQSIEFAPRDPAVQVYNGHFEDREASSLEKGILTAVGSAAERVGVPPPALDPRLSAAAEELARVAPANTQLAYPLVEFAMQRNGIIEPSPHLIMIWGQRGDGVGEVVDSLSDRLPEILAIRSAPHTRLGVGAADRDDGETCFVIAFQASYVDTKPIPRFLPLGGTLKLSGVVRAPFESPRVFVSRAGQEVLTPKLKLHSGGAFSAQLGCGGDRGRQQVEITATNAAGSTVLANFPIWCGESPPERFVYRATMDDTDPVTSEEQAVGRMLELINRDRRMHGLSPLALDPRLQQVAHAYSAEMHQTGLVAHVSPTSGSAADRIDRAGIRTPVVLENIARAYGVSQAHAGLMNSPGHRANILSKEASHIGIGVVLGEKTPVGVELFVTQLYARLPSDMPLSEATEIVARSVTRVRRLGLDPALSRIAAGFAARLAKGQPSKTVERWAGGELRAIRTTYVSVSTVATAVADIDAFDPAAELQGPRMSHFGVGVAKGKHEVMGDAAFFVVLLLAEK